MKVEVDREVLVWLHKQPRNVFLTVVGAVLGLIADPYPPNSTAMRTAQAGDFASATTGSSTAWRATS